MARRCTINSLPNYCHDVMSHDVMMSRVQGKTHQCKQRKQNDYLMFIYSYCVYIGKSRSYLHFQRHSFNISGNCTVHISLKKALSDDHFLKF